MVSLRHQGVIECFAGKSKEELCHYSYHGLFGLRRNTDVPAYNIVSLLDNKALLDACHRQQEALSNYPAIIRFFYRLFNINNAKLNRYRLAAAKAIEEGHSPIAYYQESINFYAKKSYFYQQGKADTFFHRLKGHLQGLLFSGKISFVLQQLRHDLKNISSWSEYEAKAGLLSDRDGRHRGEVYVAAYRSAMSRFQRLSVGAFHLRRHYEEKLRGKKDYLSLLQQLDTGLLGLDEEITAAKATWQQTIASHYAGDDFFKRANACFDALNVASVHRMQDMNWVYHTAYGWRETEAYLAYEMDARNKTYPHKKFERYHLEKCKTLSDYIVDSARESAKEAKRIVYLNVHPDKGLVGDARERIVREYCSQALSTLCEQTLHLTDLWHKGQWREVAPVYVLQIQDKEPVAGAGAGGTHHEDDDEVIDDCEVTRLAPPEHELDLSVLAVHQRYVDWVATQPDVTKRLYRDESEPLVHDFYTDDPNDEFRRLLFAHRQDFCAKNATETKRNLRLAERANQESEVLRQEAEELNRRAEESDKRAEESDKRAEESDKRAEESDKRAEESDKRAEAVLQAIKKTTILYLSHKLQKKFGKLTVQTISDEQVMATLHAAITGVNEIYTCYSHQEMQAWAIELIQTAESLQNIPALVYLRDNFNRLFPSAEAVIMVDSAPPVVQAKATAAGLVEGKLKTPLALHGMFPGRTRPISTTMPHNTSPSEPRASAGGGFDNIETINENSAICSYKKQKECHY